MKVLTIFKRKKKSKKAKGIRVEEGGGGIGSGGATTDDETTHPTSSMSPEPEGDDDDEDEGGRTTGDDYYSDISRSSPNPPSISGDSPRDGYSPSPIPSSPSPSPYPPSSPAPSTSRSLSPSPNPSSSPAPVHSSQKATLALLASLAAGVARERRVSFELPRGKNIISDDYYASSPNLRASTPLIYHPSSSAPATPPSALRSSANFVSTSSPSSLSSLASPPPDVQQSPPPPASHPLLSQSAPQPPVNPAPQDLHPEPHHEESTSPEPAFIESEGEHDNGEDEYGEEGEEGEEFEGDYEAEEEDEEDEAALFLAMREKRRRGRPLSNLERRIQVIEEREKWLGEQEILLKEESERLADLNINLNMEVQAVERQKRAAQRAEVSARTRVRKAEEILHMKEKAIDIVKEGLQDDKKAIQMKRDILLVQRAQMKTGRRTTPYKFPKLLPSRKVNGLVSDDLNFHGSGISSLPWRRQPPPSLIAEYAPAASIPRGTTPSVSPPPRNVPKPRTPVNRAGASTPNGTPVVTIDLSTFAESNGSTRSYSPASSRHSSTPPLSFTRKHRASFPNIYLYEQEGENDFADMEEGPITLRLHSGDEEDYTLPEDEEIGDANGGLEGEAHIGEESGGEGSPGEEPEPIVQEEASSPEPIPTSPPQPNKTAKSKKKQTNLMQQLQLHMTPQQQQRFQINSPLAHQAPQTRIPTTPTTSDTPIPIPVSTPSPAPTTPTPTPTPTPISTPQRKPSPPKKVPSDDGSRPNDDKAKRGDVLAKPPERKPPPPPPQGEPVPAIMVSPSVPNPNNTSTNRLQHIPSAGSVARQTTPQSQPQAPQQPPPSQPPQGYPQYSPYPYQPYQQPSYQPFQQPPHPQYQAQQYQPYPYQPIYQQPQPQQPQQPQQPTQPHPHPPPQYQQQHQARSISPSKQNSLTNSGSPSFSATPQKQTTKQNSSSSITSPSPLPSNGNPQLSPKPTTSTAITPAAPSSPSTNKRSLSPQKQTPPAQPTPAPTQAPAAPTPPSPTSPKKQLPVHPHEVHVPSPPLQLLPESSLLSEPLATDSENISVISLSNEKFKAGFLAKREGTGMAVSWPRKYIVMTKAGLLYYFRSAVDFTTSGYTDLNNYIRIKIPEDPKNRHNYPKFTFQLVRKKTNPPSPTANGVPSSSATSNKLLLSADNKKEMQAWMSAISLFWEMEAEKEKSSKRVTIITPSPIPVPAPPPVSMVRTPSPPVKVVPPPEVKPAAEAVQSGGMSSEPFAKRRPVKGRKFVS